MAAAMCKSQINDEITEDVHGFKSTYSTALLPTEASENGPSTGCQATKPDDPVSTS